MKTFTWVHLTDLHVGMEEGPNRWSNIEHRVLEDFDGVLEKTVAKKIDVVFFTGDLTYSGSKAQFTALDKILEKILARLKRGGHRPALVAVPGNHDLDRSKANHGVATTLKELDRHPDVRADLWENAKGDYRASIESTFRQWRLWSGRLPWDQFADVKRDKVLPGDFIATWTRDDLRIGILGLNSAALQMHPGDYEGRLTVDARQATSLVDPFYEWIQDHHACFLLTHHSSEWLDDKGRESLHGEINRPGYFSIHLCGHEHEQDLVALSWGGDSTRQLVVGRSLFGIEHYDDTEGGKIERTHGYSIGELYFGSEPGFRLWPRHNVREKSGSVEIKSDQGLPLEDDEGTQLIPVNLSMGLWHPPLGEDESKPSPRDGRALDAIAAIDLRPYVSHLLTRRVPARGTQYVSPNVRDDSGEVHAAEDLIKRLLFEDSAQPRRVVLLGGPGSGKTTLLERIATELASARRADERNPAPLFLSLRNQTVAGSLPAALAHELRKGAIDVDQAGAIELLRRRNVVLLLDGLDEMFLTASTEDARRSAQEVRLFSELGGGRSVVSCRTEYFAQLADVDLLGPHSRLTLEPWDKSRISAFLMSALPPETSLEALIEDIPAAMKLARTPLLLAMLAETAREELRQELLPASLYGDYASRLIQLRTESHVVSHEEKRATLQRIAWEMFCSRRDTISAEAIRELAPEPLGDCEEDLDRFAGEVRSSTLLVRCTSVAGEYRFIHRSFFEYFLAKHVASLVRLGAYTALEKADLTDGVGAFVAQLLRDFDDYRRLHLWLDELDAPEFASARRNAAVILKNCAAIPPTAPEISGDEDLGAVWRDTPEAVRRFISEQLRETTGAALLGQLRDQHDIDTRIESILRTMWLGYAPGIEALGRLLINTDDRHASDYRVARLAALALGLSGNPVYEPILLDTAMTPARLGKVRQNAIVGLGLLGDPSAVSALAAALEAEDDPEVRRSAVWAIERLDPPAALDSLSARALSDSSSEVRQYAAWALGRIGSAALATLPEVLNDPVQDVQMAAIDAIASVCDEQALALLESAEHTTSGDLRLYLRQAISRVRQVLDVYAS